MKKKVILVGTLAIGMLVFGLFQVKYKVYNLKRDLAEINRQLAADTDAIQVLKAEWAYLNKPERIEKLARKYLNLHTINVAQIYRENQVGNLYYASTGSSPSSNSNTVTPVLRPILSSARSY